MTIILFLIILAVLIFVHELGHFIVAKLSGMKVEEFALGFPPRIASFQRGETRYSLNIIPFGGYVKILGESLDESQATSENPADDSRSFAKSPKWKQFLVLVAGISMNVVFAWLLISLGYFAGLPTSASDANLARLSNAHVAVVEVIPGSPADKAGFESGDSIVALASGGDVVVPQTAKEVSAFVQTHGQAKLKVGVIRGKDTIEREVVPEKGVIEGQYGIGISMDVIGILKLPLGQSLVEGAKLTCSLIAEVAEGLAAFLVQAFTFHADFSQVSGPVGIVSVVGSAAELGLAYVISLTAFISINLAVLNLVPFPALDGGRILFVAIEAVKGSPIRPKIANALNIGGFALLILMMAAVTVHDVLRFFL